MPKQNRITDTTKQELWININHMKVCFLMQRGPKKSIDPEVENLIQSSLHTHAFGELFICKQGHTRIHIAQSFVDLAQDDCLYVPPNLPHICISAGKNIHMLSVGIQFENRSVPDARALRNRLYLLSDSGKPLILRDNHAFIEEWDHLLSVSAEDIDSVLALQMVALLTKMVADGFECLTYGQTHPNSEFSPDVKRVAELEYIIDAQFMTGLSREAVAKKLFISTRQLDRICKKRYGKTFHEQVTERRMVTASALLTDTNMSAEEVSRSVGFLSSSNFYKAFHKKFGLTPHEYRSKSRRLL